jgi:hypothetical protein
MGVGKTSLAAKFDKSLILGFESGTNALNNVYVLPIKTWKDFRQAVSQLTRNEKLKEKYHSIAFDTCDEAYKLCERWCCAEAGVETVKEIAAYGGGYKIVEDAFSQPLRDLAYAGYGLIFISHETEKPYVDDNGEEYNKIVPALANRPFNVINKMVDIIGYVREIPIKEGEEVHRERFIFLRGDERFLTKSRFKHIKPRVKLDYNEFVDAIYEAIDKEIQESGGEATEEANPYLEQSFDDLMEEAKELWIKVSNLDKTDEALKILEEEFGKPTRFSEITAEGLNELKKSILRIREITA